MRRQSSKTSLTDSSKDAIVEALVILGCASVRWKGETLHFETNGQRLQLSPEVMPEWVCALELPIDQEQVVIAMSEVTGIDPPRETLRDFDSIRHRILPRLVSRDAFDGPDRAMCRREVGTDLFASMWIGLGRRGLWVTTSELDAWPVDFEECLLIAKQNLRECIENGTVNEISDGHGVLAALAEGPDLSGSMLDLPALLPEQFERGSSGALVTAPIVGTLLMLPVANGIGAEGVASIVQIADMLRDDTDSTGIGARIYWAINDPEAALLGYRLEMLPVTVVHEDGERRAHVDSSDLVQALLRKLGEID